jgi:hypothetical protein
MTNVSFRDRESKIAELEAVLAILECEPCPRSLARRTGIRAQIHRLRGRQRTDRLKRLLKNCVAPSQDAH